MVYQEWGNPASADVLVCAHGLTRNRHDFDPLAERMAADGWRVVTFDMPGRGDSEYLPEPAQYNIANYLPICAALLARLDVDDVAWLGTSMGGIVGMGLASKPDSPIKRLVLNDVGPFIPSAGLKRIGHHVGADPRFDSYSAVEHMLRSTMAGFGVKHDAHWRYLAEIAVEPDGAGRLRLRYDPGIAQVYHVSLEDIEFWPVWDAIQCPVMVLRGVDSDILLREVATDMADRGPRAKVIEIDGCGHAPLLFENDQIDLVRAWLDNSRNTAAASSAK
jgi:pimeloyl-ACP methyl ester carboxylesterase